MRMWCGDQTDPTLAPTASLPTRTPSENPTPVPFTHPPSTLPTAYPTDCREQCQFFTVQRDDSCSAELDVVFVVDSSSSIENQEYTDYKSWIFHAISDTFGDEANVTIKFLLKEKVTTVLY